MIGTTEILVIVAVILVLFGSSAIPKFARSIGRARSEFEKGLREGRKEAEEQREGDPEEKKKQ